MLFTRHRIGKNAQGDTNPAWMTAYLSKAGKPPYELRDGKEFITASQIYFPGPPNFAVAFLRIEEVTDLTVQHENVYANQVLSRISGTSGTTETYYRCAPRQSPPAATLRGRV